MSVAKWLVETYRKHRENITAGELVRESVQQKKFRLDEIHVKDLAIQACGEQFATKLLAYGAAARTGGGFLAQETRESAEALDASTFGAVFGSVMVEISNEAYEAAASEVLSMFDPYPTPDQLDEITEYKQAQSTNGPETVAPNMPYPKSGAATWYIKIPKPEKVGQICQVGLEFVVSNRTKPIFDMVRANTEIVAIDLVERCLRTLLGITNTYNRNGTTYNTYLTSGLYVNALDDFDLDNGPDEVDRLEQLFANMVDPVTGKNVILGGTQIFVPKSNLRRTQKVVSTTEIRKTVSNTQTIYKEPGGLTDPISDRHARRLLTTAYAPSSWSAISTAIADTYFLYGDFKGAFGYREVKPFEVLERNAELASDINWEQDIVYAVKPRFWGVPFTKDPMKVTRGRKTS